MSKVCYRACGWEGALRKRAPMKKKIENFMCLFSDMVNLIPIPVLILILVAELIAFGLGY